MKRKHFMNLCMLLIYIMLCCTGCAQKENDSLPVQEQDSSDTQESENSSESQTVDDIDAEEAEHGEESSPEPENAVSELEKTEQTSSEIPVYSYTELSEAMYAASAVNVRDQPSVEGEKIGSLAASQEVDVTGQCNETSWYRIEYQGQIGYVSNNYIVAEKPVAEKPVAEVPIVAEVPDISQSTEQSGLISIDNLANKSSLKKKCTDEEFQAAYDAAVQIVTPLVGLSREEQLAGIAGALRGMVDNGQVVYSTEDAHYNDPYGYLVLGVASCAGCTRTTGLCLNMLGISYEHVNENQWSHQWCRVNIDGVYWICDAYGLYVGPEPEPYVHPYIE